MACNTTFTRSVFFLLVHLVVGIATTMAQPINSTEGQQGNLSPSLARVATTYNSTSNLVPLHSFWTQHLGETSFEASCICNSPAHITYVGGDFLAKIDEEGKQAWVKTWDASSAVHINGVGADYNNNVYACGQFKGSTLKLDSIQLKGGAADNGFVAKYSSAGKILWAILLTSDRIAVAKALSLAPKGAIYVTGYFTRQAVRASSSQPQYSQNAKGAGPKQASGHGGKDAFVFKVDPLGYAQWVKSYGSAADEEGSAISTDADNRVLVAGTFSGAKLGIGKDTLCKTQAIANTTQFFLVKLDKSGTELWSLTQNDLPQSTVRGLVTDTSSSIYLTGQYVPKGERELQNYIIQYSTQGVANWAKKVRPMLETECQALVFSNRGGAVLTGTYQDTTYAGGRTATFVAGYDSNGNASWLSKIGIDNQWQAKAIAADNAGCLYIAGNAFESQHPYFSTRLGIPNAVGVIGRPGIQRRGGGYEKGEY